MWNLLKKSDEECRKLMDLLEESAALRPEAKRVEELIEVLPPAERTHMASCSSCREAAQDLLATRELFKGVASSSEMARPWFAARVMTAIVARERELALPASLWSTVPRYASRLAWFSAIVLLAGSTWLYKKPEKLAIQPTAAASPAESLFEAPSQPISQDDVLVSMAEKNR